MSLNSYKRDVFIVWSPTTNKAEEKSDWNEQYERPTIIIVKRI